MARNPGGLVPPDAAFMDVLKAAVDPGGLFFSGGAPGPKLYSAVDRGDFAAARMSGSS
jgi:hypothetical protein